MGNRAATPLELTIEHASAPNDVDVPEPRLSWQLPGVARQHAYQIAVASDPALIRSGRPDMWDSGQVVSAVQLNVCYAGTALRSNTTYFWAVRIWTTEGGKPGKWSEVSQFETGLFSAADWSARWIGRNNPETVPNLGEQARSPLLRKEFALKDRVARARLRIVGLGHYVAYINGERVGDHVLDPPPSTFDHTALYATYDVTDLLRQGDNAIGVMLGRGCFAAPRSADLLDFAAASWRNEPRLLAQLDLTLHGGGSARVVSDRSWTMKDGPILDSARVGEEYDARLEQPGWTDAGFDASGWTPAPEQQAPTRNARAMAMEPIRVTATVDPVSSSNPSPGLTVYDFGRTTAGWARISAQGNPGTTITLVYGETLDVDGTVARFINHHVDSYTLSGRGVESWEPSFTRHGFRFIEVSCSPSAPASFAIQARINHSDLRPTGQFDSSNDLLNRMQANQRASIIANMWGFPTDTPWRDRLGWTADAWLFIDSAVFNCDVQRLFLQWLRSYRDAQGADGSLPVVVPTPVLDAFNAANDPSWAGTIVLDAWALYQHYGDPRVLADNYDTMVRWMDLMMTRVARTGGVHRSFSFGDWASPGAEAGGVPFLNPPEGAALTATADLYHEARVLARIARVLHRTADAAKYDAFADETKAVFNATFFDAEANVYRTEADTGYRQTSNLMPLVYELVPVGHQAAVYANLVADIRSRDLHLNTGAIGTKQILPVLTEHGDIDLAYAIATQTSYPSWGYWLEQGATSSWETWSHAGSIQSQNHAFLGTFDDWLFMHLAGIQVGEPGYAAIRIKPAVPTGLAHASASLLTPRGNVRSAWRRTANGIDLSVTIPGNTSAEIHVPAVANDDVAAKGDAQLLRRDDRYAVFAGRAGMLTFKIRHPAQTPQRKLRAR